MGVPTENRTEDFELSTFFGIVTRNRYFSIEDTRNQPYKWVFMTTQLPDAESIYNLFTNDGTTTDDVNLVNQFRNAMINQ